VIKKISSGEPILIIQVMVRTGTRLIGFIFLKETLGFCLPANSYGQSGIDKSRA
jgi:hypothetical protein